MEYDKKPGLYVTKKSSVIPSTEVQASFKCQISGHRMKMISMVNDESLVFCFFKSIKPRVDFFFF